MIRQHPTRDLWRSLRRRRRALPLALREDAGRGAGEPPGGADGRDTGRPVSQRATVDAWLDEWLETSFGPLRAADPRELPGDGGPLHPPGDRQGRAREARAWPRRTDACDPHRARRPLPHHRPLRVPVCGSRSGAPTSRGRSSATSRRSSTRRRRRRGRCGPLPATRSGRSSRASRAIASRRCTSRPSGRGSARASSSRCGGGCRPQGRDVCASHADRGRSPSRRRTARAGRSC